MDKNFTVKYITKGYTKSGGRWMRTRIYEGTSLRCEEEWRYEGGMAFDRASHRQAR